MKASEIKEKMSKISKNDISSFFQNNWKYFTAVILFVVLAVVMIKFSSGNKDKDNGLSTEQSTESESFQVDAVPEINTLMQNYYNAYAAGDLATLQTYATPVSENEQSLITMMSQYAESYQNIKCYTKSGLEADSYLVCVTLDLKFAGVDTTAPGMEFFYVKKNEQGAFYIDNLYSSFNRHYKEQPTDNNVENLISSFETQEDVIALQAEVQANYEKAIASDENLSNMVTVTIADAYNAWATAIAQAQAQQQPATEEPATEETPAEPEAPAEPETPAEPEVTTETVYTLDKVNVRQEPNESGALLGTVEKGTALTRTGTTEDGWSSIDYNGTPAYVKSDYVSTEAPAQEPAADTSGIAAGTKITLTNTVNIRSSMSETASKVGVAYAGDSVTVQMSYAEGWTKVTWKDKEGYVKTEFLK